MDGTIDVVFWIMSAGAIGAALLVVTVKDVFRAALALAGSFLAVAGIFFLLQAEFVAVAQHGEGVQHAQASTVVVELAVETHGEQQVVERVAPVALGRQQAAEAVVGLGV